MFQVRSTSKTAARIVGAVAAGIGLLLPLGAEPPDLVCGTQLPLPPAGLYRLSSATAAPGEEVRLSFYATPDYETGSVCATVDFDEGVLQVRSVEQVFVADKSEWGSRYFDFSNEDATPGNAGVCEEGFVVLAGAMFEGVDERGQLNWPPVFLAADVETEIAAIRFLVRPDAPPGVTQVRFQDSAPDRRPSSSNDWKNALGFPDGGLHTVDVIHGSITIEGLRWRLRRCGATASAG